MCEGDLGGACGGGGGAGAGDEDGARVAGSGFFREYNAACQAVLEANFAQSNSAVFSLRITLVCAMHTYCMKRIRAHAHTNTDALFYVRVRHTIPAFTLN